MGYSEEDILEAMESGQAYSTYSLQQTFDEGGNEGESAVFERYTAETESGYGSIDDVELVKTVLVNLSDQEKKVFQMRYFNERTQQEIADEMGVSQMTISRIEKKVKEKFKSLLQQGFY